MSKGQFKETLLPGQRQSYVLSDLTEEETRYARAIVEGFYRKKEHPDPVAKSNDRIFCAINSITMDSKGRKSEWLNAPGKAGDSQDKILMNRLIMLCGRGFKQYLEGTPTTSNKPRKNRAKNKTGPKPKVREELVITEHDLDEISRRKRMYIDEFGFSTRPDLGLLDRLVRIEIAVENYETSLITGEGSLDSKAADSIKKLTETMINIQKTLGITAEQRSKVKTQSKEGTVAELFQTYEDTKREKPDLDMKWMLEELDMLLRKHNRYNEKGDREISAPVFKRFSGGISVNEAYKLLGRKIPDLHGSEESDEV